MLPTKGYFQDIECPFYNSSCGRPYCHFRHKRKLNENVEEIEQDTTSEAVPTYKPTPKSELANIHNSKSHIPISYVPDLAFNRERPARPLPKIEKPTYKPTPLSILSSATNLDGSLPENDKHRDTIQEIQQNIANKAYDPLKSEIDFEDLSNEFDLIDDIIKDTEPEPQEHVTKDLKEIENDIEEQQNKLNLLKSKLSSAKAKEKSITSVPEINNVKVKEEDKSQDIKVEKDQKPKDIEKRKKDETKSDKDKLQKSEKKRTHSSDSKIKEKLPKKSDSLKHDKSNDREKHRKEEKKNCSKEEKTRTKSKHRDKSPDSKKTKKEKHVNKDNKSASDSDVSDSSVDKEKKKHKKHSKHRSRSKTKVKEKYKKAKERKKSRSKSRSLSKESKSKHKSRPKSKSRHKQDRKRSRSREKNKSPKKKDRKKDGTSQKDKHSNKSDKEKYKKKSTSESSNNPCDIEDSVSNDNILETEEYIPSDIDLDFEDEDETMRECYKIFNEYKPEPVKVQKEPQEIVQKDLFDEKPEYQGKKRTAHAGADVLASTGKKLPEIPKPKPVLTPGQILANRYKVIKMSQQNNEQENIMNEVKTMISQPNPIKRQATSLLEAARMHKMKRIEEQKLNKQKKVSSSNVVDDILNGVHKPTANQVKIQPKKINAVPNVALIQKAKERISLIKQQRSETVKTVAQTQKSGRVAHVPEFTLSDIPDVLQADKSKLPVNVRTRFLTLIADECGKLYASKQDAYDRALNEEFTCYEKCKVLATYRNSAMLAVNRLRKEIQERESKGLGLLLSGESEDSGKESDFKGNRFYQNIKKWVLTEEELDLHGYPRESDLKGKAVINNRKPVDFSMVDDNYRKCSRCSKTYQVDDDGWALFEEECLYHPLKKRTIRGEQIHLCCKSNDDTGCLTSDTHVFDGLESHILEGFQTTMPSERENDPRSVAVYALDCEMCYTTRGLELTRVTIVDTDCKTVYESLVKPLNPIIDYNTRFSGITKEQMDKTSTSILQVQANILHLCNSETILVGHSLESDMKALKIIHSSIVDTSVLFPHKMGLPHKRALRALASEYLKKIIQNDVSGHDSAEDAIACMELIKWKLKEELKVRTK
ncbi:RNA exonuclease 1 homolog [Sitophilus oryzae]|uniref:RNA exonuclease 1 homolog n=1 Tax=Sitophilus oryzae TaxID=7048 RepID=A0A6J2YRS6_SITOR|nr:RNA exonuclease 1 homolog [Sitophilus oryzae]